MYTRILQTQLELKQNVLENKLIQQENMWIKPHIRLIKIKSDFSGAHFDDKFPTFGVPSYIMGPAPIFRMARVCEILCWNHIRDSHTVLKQYNLTCWQLTALHETDVLSWMSIFNLLVNENDFEAPVEGHRFLKSHDIALHASFHCHDKCHYEKLEHVVVMISRSGNVTIGRKTIYGLTHVI